MQSVTSTSTLFAALVISAACGSVALPAHAADLPARPPKSYQPASEEFDTIGQGVVQLLQSKDAGRFATNLSASAQDWNSLASTNLGPEDLEKLTNFAKSAHRNTAGLEADAKAFLKRAGDLHLDFSKTNLQFRVIVPKYAGQIYYSENKSSGLNLPYLQKLELVLTTGGTNESGSSGGFKLVARAVEKFPAGWKIGHLQWSQFPTNVVDDQTRREMAILEKVANYQGFTGTEDPALLKMGEALVRFLRTRDTAGYEKDLLMSTDSVWAMIQKAGREGPSRQEVDEEITKRNQEQVRFAQAVVQLMDGAGLDLKDAGIQIESAGVERAQSPMNAASLDGLMGSQFKLRFSVKTEGKAKNGAALSGNYVLGAKEVTRMGGEWKVVDDLHWEELPEGVVDAEATAKMKFENYVAEHGALPPQTPAPDIEFITLDGERKMKLSELKRKVVILDFWATWCGPCQGPMAELQKLRQEHADWADRVAIVPLSIDDTMAAVRKHVDQRGWTNTFNVWAGEGGWHAAPAKTYRVTGVPTSYVIDQEGKITWAGHPAGASFEEKVERLLNK